MRISAKGRLTIPMDVLKEAGLLPYTEIDLIVEQDGIRIVRAREPRGPSIGDIMIARLKRAKGHATMTTDEVMELTRSEV